MSAAKQVLCGLARAHLAPQLLSFGDGRDETGLADSFYRVLFRINQRTTFSIIPVHWRSSHPQMKHLSLLKGALNILYLRKPLPSSPDPGVIYLNSGTEPRKKCTPSGAKHL